MHIGILQTGHPPEAMIGETGEYSVFFENLLSGNDFTYSAYSVCDGVFPDGALAADGWVITGSKHSSYDDLPWIAPLEQLIVDIADSGRPMVGICFGHQIIAQALGGKVEKFRKGWAVGRQTYDFGDEKLSLNAWHQDQVVELPPGAQVIAANDFCENAALVIGKNILTVQAHPEYGADFIEGLIEHRGGALPADLVAEARSNLNKPTDNDALADRMAAFLKKGAK